MENIFKRIDSKQGVQKKYSMSFCYLLSAGTFPNASSWGSNRVIRRKAGGHKQVSCTLGMPKNEFCLFACFFFKGESNLLCNLRSGSIFVKHSRGTGETKK